ncbi:MAG: hypothetical protein IT442_16750, partial [Phycisphaeraceae bacterium]|nr:hypothetical protein [Phycisphaeraceae bacterium]
MTAAVSASTANLLNLGRRGQTAKTVPYNANNPESIDIPRTYPLDGLRCRLNVNCKITSTLTLAYFGIANLIESITVRKNSKDVIFYADGRQLALISATRKLH